MRGESLDSISSSPSAPGAPPLAEYLPHELLVHVLSFAQLPLRLGPCSLTCKSWHAAALEATSTLTVVPPQDLSSGPAHQDNVREGEVVIPAYGRQSLTLSVQQWLGKHGSALQHLGVTQGIICGGRDRYPLLQLAFGQLQRLVSLKCCMVQLQRLTSCEVSGKVSTSSQQQQWQQQQLAVQGTTSRTSSSAGISTAGSSRAVQASLRSLTGLTALHLEDVNGWDVDLAGLSYMTGLRRLQLAFIQSVGAATYWQLSWQQRQQHDREQQDWVISALQQLTQLTHLRLHADLLDAKAVGVFSCLQQLQELELWDGGCIYPAAFDGLPNAITKLLLDAQFEPVGSGEVPVFQQLSDVQYLETRNTGRLDTVSKVTFGSLQHLRVVALSGLLDSDVMPALLAALPACGAGLPLESLQLRMELPKFYDGVPVPVPNAAMYSRLLSSMPQLTRLELSWRDEHARLLPGGCGQNLFAAGLQVSGLKELELGFKKPEYWSKFWCVDVHPGFHHVYYIDLQPILCPGDVDRLVHCCPALERLWLPGLVEPGVDVSALRSLTALTGLFVGGEVFDDVVAVNVLAKMSGGLQQLELRHAPQLTDHGLLALSALTGLTKLCLLHCGLGEDVCTAARKDIDVEEEKWCDYFEPKRLLLVCKQDCTSAVWLQLLEACTVSEVCGHEAKQQLAQLSELPHNPNQPSKEKVPSTAVARDARATSLRGGAAAAGSSLAAAGAGHHLTAAAAHQPGALDSSIQQEEAHVAAGSNTGGGSAAAGSGPTTSAGDQQQPQQQAQPGDALGVAQHEASSSPASQAAAPDAVAATTAAAATAPAAQYSPAAGYQASAAPLFSMLAVLLLVCAAASYVAVAA